MPGQCRYGVNKLEAAVAPLVENGLKAVLLFGVPENIEKVWIRIISFCTASQFATQI